MVSPLRDVEYENHPFIASGINRDHPFIASSINRDVNNNYSIQSPYDLEIQDDYAQQYVELDSRNLSKILSTGKNDISVKVNENKLSSFLHELNTIKNELA
jgi:uncharacterized protein YabE (DUF348 family)